MFTKKKFSVLVIETLQDQFHPQCHETGYHPEDNLTKFGCRPDIYIYESQKN